MPEFLHALSEAKNLFQLIADDKGLRPAVVEKDYWIMHCLWGLQQLGLQFEMKGGTSLSKGWGVIDRFSEDIDIRFDAPSTLNVKGDKPAHVAARFSFYDDLAARIKMDGLSVTRNRGYDDPKAQNGGISLSELFISQYIKLFYNLKSVDRGRHIAQTAGQASGGGYLQRSPGPQDPDKGRLAGFRHPKRNETTTSIV